MKPSMRTFRVVGERLIQETDSTVFARIDSDGNLVWNDGKKLLFEDDKLCKEKETKRKTKQKSSSKILAKNPKPVVSKAKPK